MPDISMCPDTQCPLASSCRRSPVITRHDQWQTFFCDSPRSLATFGVVECRYYWPVRQ
jgi:hypothetical protein